MSRFSFVIIAAVCLLFAPAAIRCQKKSDLEWTKLRGKVKSVETSTSYFDPTKGWSICKPWLIETYNETGNALERSVYRDGVFVNKILNLYDARGRNVGNESYSEELKKIIANPTRTEFVLDDAGNTIEMKFYSGRGAAVSTLRRFKYDGRGNQIERDHGRSGKSVMTFDERNNETSVVNSDAAGVVYGKSITEYDDKDRRVKLVIYGDGMSYRDARLRWETTYRYDEQNRIVEQAIKQFNSEPNVYTSHAPEAGKIVYKYDDANRTKETAAYTSDGYLKGKSITISNERGDETAFECDTADAATCKRIIDYQYDQMGNWTKKTYQARQYTGDVLRAYHAEERVISYY